MKRGERKFEIHSVGPQRLKAAELGIVALARKEMMKHLVVDEVADHLVGHGRLIGAQQAVDTDDLTSGGLAGER